MNSKRRIELIDKIEKVARGRDVLARLDRLVTPWRPMGHMRSTSVALLLLVLAFTMRAQGASSSGPLSGRRVLSSTTWFNGITRRL